MTPAAPLPTARQLMVRALEHQRGRHDQDRHAGATAAAKDILGLAKRIVLDEGETFIASDTGKIQRGRDQYGVPMVLVNTPAGPRLRLGEETNGDATRWDADTSYGVRAELDRGGIRRMRDNLDVLLMEWDRHEAHARALGKRAAAANIMERERMTKRPPTLEELAERPGATHGWDITYDPPLTADEARLHQEWGRYWGDDYFTGELADGVGWALSGSDVDEPGVSEQLFASMFFGPQPQAGDPQFGSRSAVRSFQKRLDGMIALAEGSETTPSPTPEGAPEYFSDRILEHRPGGKDHPQENHGRWSPANRARTAARELDELRTSIGIAQTRRAPRPAPQIAEASPTATPTRMTKAQYTKRLKDEHVRLLLLDGKTEKQAKAAARPTADIDELKERNSTLRRKLKAQGIDYRTEEQRNADDAEKKTLLDEVEKLAAASGYDGQAKRAGAAKMSPRELRKFVEDVKAYQRRQKDKTAARQQGPTAETAWQAAEDNSRASSRQVGYIMGLLKARGGNPTAEGGFMLGPTTKEDVAKMTKAEASAYINSLRGDY